MDKKNDQLFVLSTSYCQYIGNCHRTFLSVDIYMMKHNSAVLTGYLFRQWPACVHVPNWKNVLQVCHKMPIFLTPANILVQPLALKASQIIQYSNQESRNSLTRRIIPQLCCLRKLSFHETEKCIFAILTLQLTIPLIIL